VVAKALPAAGHYHHASTLLGASVKIVILTGRSRYEFYLSE